MAKTTDRRKYARLKKRLNVEFRPMDVVGEYSRSEHNHISLGGLRVDTPPSGALMLGQMVELHLVDPKGKLDPLQALGKVAWIRKKDTGQGFESGIALTFMAEGAHSKFSEYILNHSFSKNGH